MSDDAELNRIRAEAFQEMEAAYEQSVDASTIGKTLADIIDAARQKILNRSTRFAEALAWLASTRWKRLQQTQFVYWSARIGHPRIELSNGQHAYLQEHAALVEITESELAERLAEEEARLFGAAGEDETKVYWQGWEILACANPRKVQAQCRYFIAHIWEDGTVSPEPSSHKVIDGPNPKGWAVAEQPSRLYNTGINKHRCS